MNYSFVVIENHLDWMVKYNSYPGYVRGIIISFLQWVYKRMINFLH